MRSSRSRVRAASYDSEAEEEEWQRAGPSGGGGNAAPARTAAATGGGGGSAGSGQHGPGGGLEEWEEAELLAMLSPESQKRERRRIANRDCARRIRQRKTELLAELTASVEALQADNARLLATLKDVTRCWRDTTIENCELRAQVVLLQAGGSGGSRASGGTTSGGSGGSGSGLPSPVGLPALGSPGWPSPMAL